MLIIWRGLGILVPLLTAGVIFLVKAATDALFGAGCFDAHGLPKLLGFWCAAAFIWLFGAMLDDDHSFFFIPVKYWAFILAFFGLVALFL
ncbi:MAG TPA: hypothetical protein VF546_20930 [Pyrinomonadaceae bacterium]|jgi:hypothetical protein